jgi:tetratricopeptide (TPR) repeat protein
LFVSFVAIKKVYNINIKGRKRVVSLYTKVIFGGFMKRSISLSLCVLFLYLLFFPAFSLGQCYSDVCFNKGLDYAMRGLVDEARGQFAKTLQYDKYFKAAEEGLRVINDFKKGALSREALKNYFKGVYYFNRQRFEMAIESFSKAIELSPDYYMSYYNRGVVNSVLKNYELAIKDFTESIKRNPLHAESYYNRAVMLTLKGETENALKDYKKAIKLSPSLYRAYYNMGMIYFRKGDYRSAVAQFTGVLTIKPNYTRAFIRRGMAYQRLGQMQKACDDYREACKRGKCTSYEAAATRGLCKKK